MFVLQRLKVLSFRFHVIIFLEILVSEAALGYISLILADGNCVINAANIDALLQSVGLIGNDRSLIMSFMTCLISSIYLTRCVLGSNSF